MKKKVSKQELQQRELTIYGMFCTGTPPLQLLDEENSDLLQDWVANHLRPEVTYATAISVMDAASAISFSQIDNGMEMED